MVKDSNVFDCTTEKDLLKNFIVVRNGICEASASIQRKGGFDFEV